MKPLLTTLVLFVILAIVFVFDTIGKPNSNEPLQLEDLVNGHTYYQKAKNYKEHYPDSAIIYAQEASAVFEQSGEKVPLAEVYALIAEILDQQGNFGLAVEYFHNSLDIYTSLQLDDKVLEVKNQLGRTCAEALLIETSLKHLTDALTIAEQVNNDLGVAQTIFNLAYTYERSSQPEIAISYYKKADSINQIIKNPALETKIIEAFGSIYEDLEQYGRALTYYMRVYPMYEDAPFEKIDVVNNIGDMYRKTDRAAVALTYYYQSYQLAKKLGLSRKVGQSSRDLAFSYFDLDQLDSAFKYLNEYNEYYLKSYDEASARNINTLQILYESERQNKEIELQKSTAKNRTFQRNAILAALILLIFLMLVLGYYYYEKSKLNKVLNDQNTKISQQSEELKKTNDELGLILEQLKETQDQLVNSEKMAAVGILAAGIAHEINNPLNFIKGGIEVLDHFLDDHLSKDKSKIEKVLNGIHEGVERASNIVSSLNNFSRKGEKMDEICDIHAITDNCLIMLQFTLKNNIDITKEYSSQKLTCLGNAGQLHQVVLNILSNAIQAVEDEGEILLKTKLEKDAIIISVKDNGHGISNDHLNKIFDPFFTTKEPGKGTGLGLSVSSRIIEDHGGALKVKSKKNNGTTVHIHLPANV